MALKFDIEKTVNYWLNGAEYDLETAEAMLKAKRYPYALFMGHLAVEKLLKALVVKKTENHAPYIHSLPVLAKKLGDDMPEEITDKLAGFMEFYQESRYPEEEMEFYKKCTAGFTAENFDEIKRVFKWLKAKL
ncbi:HEPN domain-containing protein [candidate division TA06 bacterium]|uniref:HEPN domain-containing protein n=1 Tax=candidate division TA06 bacterium TaxID=2250710 RepID=A0A933I7R5_UNCT6|nr:HEPN domain-containing protein [candidate division TA06 bacterium]